MKKVPSLAIWERYDGQFLPLQEGLEAHAWVANSLQEVLAKAHVLMHRVSWTVCEQKWKSSKMTRKGSTLIWVDLQLHSVDYAKRTFLQLRVWTRTDDEKFLVWAVPK